MENINELTKRILEFAFEVHTQLGAGLLESSYKSCLYYELVNDNLRVEKQVNLPIIYKRILTYMKLSKINHGLLINFNVP